MRLLKIAHVKSLLWIFSFQFLNSFNRPLDLNIRPDNRRSTGNGKNNRIGDTDGFYDYPEN
jgi:hypothetical protein